MMHAFGLLALLLVSCSNGNNTTNENFECTLFNTPLIPEAEDFPMYLACWSDRGRVVFFWWHEVSGKLSTLTEADIEAYRLPNEWFDEETGDFIPSAFWGPELGIIHEINGVHDPCEVPGFAEFADLPCEPVHELNDLPPAPTPGIDDDSNPETDDLTEEEAWAIVNQALLGPRAFWSHYQQLCTALKALEQQVDNPLYTFFINSLCH